MGVLKLGTGVPQKAFWEMLAYNLELSGRSLVWRRGNGERVYCTVKTGT